MTEFLTRLFTFDGTATTSLLDDSFKLLARVFDFSRTLDYLHMPWILNALAASAILGVMTGLIAPFVVLRGMSFAVHGTSELGFTGAAAALLLGFNVGAGAIAGGLIASVTFGVLAIRQRERDSVIGVVLAFGMGLGVLMLSLYQGRSANKFGLLIGSIFSIDRSDLRLLGVSGIIVVGALLTCYRPLLFTSADPAVAAARGVNTRLISIVFAVLVGLTTSLAVPIVGAILVLALAVTPGAAAARVSSNPSSVIGLSVVIAVVASVGGTVLSLGPGLPASGYITTIVFLLYVACRIVSRLRSNRMGFSHSSVASS